MMAGYWVYLFAITVAYFSAWKLAKIYLSHKSSALEATAIYVAAVGVIFSLLLLVNDRMISACLVSAIGFTVAMVLVELGQSNSEKQ